MTKIIALLAASVLLTGCFTRQATKAFSNLKDDNATVNLSYRGIYGTFSATRTNPRTNQTAVVIDGTVIVGDKVQYQKP